MDVTLRCLDLATEIYHIKEPQLCRTRHNTERFLPSGVCDLSTSAAVDGAGGQKTRWTEPHARPGHKGRVRRALWVLNRGAGANTVKEPRAIAI